MRDAAFANLPTSDVYVCIYIYASSSTRSSAFDATVQVLVI